ncbi:MAG TPA: hypothetical protein ENI23_09325 [bacterium]|nr:hypothetical protein [bacterium]
MKTEGFFDENLGLAADCEYWMRVGERFKINKINEFLAIERDHGEMQREKKKTDLQKELCLVRRKHYEVDSFSYKS